MQSSALDYHLPPDRIATEPAEPRDAARLMVIDRESGEVEHLQVRDLPQLVSTAGPLRPGDLMVFNRTRVVPALFEGVRTATGGRVRGLYLDSAGDDSGAITWSIMLEARGSLRVGETITLDGAQLALVESLGGGQWRARLSSQEPTLALLDRIGSTPLPPYIRQQRKAHGDAEVRPGDAERYNTVIADAPGSVAAPTAALHFTDDLLDRLSAAGVGRATLTLHIGLGTFAPIRTDTVEAHPIHAEWMTVPGATIDALAATRSRGGRIVPVGTTSVRALESLPMSEDSPRGREVAAHSPHPAAPFRGGPPTSPMGRGGEAPSATDFTTSTRLFITPGFGFRYTDKLLTNFHLPRSTLLALVGALPGVGVDQLRAWYALAVDRGYRFYSYGDAMLII